MLDKTAQSATCRIQCGEESGTGFLVSSKLVLTASHCLEDPTESNSEVDVVFEYGTTKLPHKAKVLDYDESLDVALLELDSEPDLTPLTISCQMPLDGSKFYSYGWPVAKLTIGHRLEGKIIQTFEATKLKSDIEISINQELSLSSYKGFSGAALICDEACVGIIRVSIEKTLHVISTFTLRHFLAQNDIPITQEESLSNNETIASRFEFVKQFDELLTKNCNSYRFINGAHGIGKSTFCDTYSPLNDSLEHFATYSFSQSQKSKNAVQLAQPIEFFNWLNMQVSKLINGTPIRTDNYDYHRLIKETEQLLSIACNKYDLNKKVGILFIDGLDEISRHDPALLSKFIGLLPIQLPKGLIIVLAAPNYEQFEAQLGQRLNKSLCISLPPLKYNSAQSFCYTNLYNEFAVPKTVNLICERAQGHPLYLRYLIDLVNSGLTKKELSDFPLIDGTIRNYYDLLWSQLKNDEAAVNLLAIVARLRWGIPISFFSEILNKSEQAILISTHSRIKLNRPEFIGDQFV